MSRNLDRLFDLWHSLDANDQRDFSFDPRVIDWNHYAPNVHLPSVVDHARVRTTPGGRTGEKREDRLRRQVDDLKTSSANLAGVYISTDTLFGSHITAGIGVFDPTLGKSYEVGAKYDLLNRRVSLTLAAFQNHWRARQAALRTLAASASTDAKSSSNVAGGAFPPRFWRPGRSGRPRRA